MNRNQQSSLPVSSKFLPELESIAHFLHYILVYGHPQRRPRATLGMEFLNLEVGTFARETSVSNRINDAASSWHIYSVLHILLTYFIQRAGRGGWEELYQGEQRQQDRRGANHFSRDDFGGERQHSSTTNTNTLTNIEQLRGDKRKRVFEQQRERMLNYGQHHNNVQLASPPQQQSRHLQQQDRVSCSLPIHYCTKFGNMLKTSSWFLLRVRSMQCFIQLDE